jgi:hypothetical protein
MIIDVSWPHLIPGALRSFHGHHLNHQGVSSFQNWFFNCLIICPSSRMKSTWRRWRQCQNPPTSRDMPCKRAEALSRICSSYGSTFWVSDTKGPSSPVKRPLPWLESAWHVRLSSLSPGCRPALYAVSIWCLQHLSYLHLRYRKIIPIFGHCMRHRTAR